jgi:hypothetical protein
MAFARWCVLLLPLLKTLPPTVGIAWGLGRERVTPARLLPSARARLERERARARERDFFIDNQEVTEGR